MSGRRRDEVEATGSGHPVMYGRPRGVVPFGRMPHGGGYPLGFLEFAYDRLGVTDVDQVLHVCSGSMREGVCVDIRAEMAPIVVGDGTRLPIRSRSFRWVLVDPPYSELLARRHFETLYPRPKRLLMEVARVLQPGGVAGFLHYDVPHAPPGLERTEIHAVYLGPHSRLRAFTVWRLDGDLQLEVGDDQLELFEDERAS